MIAPDWGLLLGAGAVVLAAYAVFGLTGFGASTVGVPLLALWLPLTYVVPMMLVFDIAAGLMLGLRRRTDVQRGELWRMAPWVAGGMLLGVTALVNAPQRVLLAVLGAFVLLYSAQQLRRAFAPGRAAAAPPGEQRPRASTRWAPVAGTVGGVFTALYGTGGPIYTVYLARRLADPQALRATIGTMIFFTAWARLVLFAATGLLWQPSLPTMVAALLPCALAGTWIGSHVHGRLPLGGFTRVVWSLLSLSGIGLLWRALRAAL